MLTGVVAVHHQLATFIDSASLFLNAILLYLILNHSRFAMKEFKWIFMLTCAGDSMLSAIVLFGQPYILFDEGHMLLISNGYFSGRSALVDHAAMTAFCSTLHINIVFVVMQYIWRNSLICGGRSFVHVGKSIVIYPAIWCVIQVVTAIWCWTVGQEELRDEANRILLKHGWQFDNATAPYPSVVPGASFKTIVHHVFYLSSSILGYMIIVYCQYGVVKFLRQLGMPSHHRTHRANNEIKRALVALALTPLCSLIPTAVMIGSNALQIPLGHTISAYLSLGMTIITLANPIVTMYFVRPYREALLNMFCCPRRVAPYSQSTTVICGKLELATRFRGPTESVMG
ncbi:7TM GPCR protein [Aphelenchoides avenae]|nr:7TM GPCR protein [Aphelenchus avenae]